MLLALSVPAVSKPAPRGAENESRSEVLRAAQIRQARDLRQAAQKKGRAALRGQDLRAPRAHARLRPGERAMAHAAPVSGAHAKPAFGWPALVTEARKYIGTNPTARKRLWCATFMNFVLAKVGYSGTGSDAAKSFASYGKRIYEPRVGAIAVLTRGKRGGHVGIVTGIDANGNPIIISGNHGKRVGEGRYSRNRVIAYVMPTGEPQRTRYAMAGSAPMPTRAADADGDGVPSPIAELLAAINSESPRQERTPAPPPSAAAQAPSQQPQPQPQRVVQQMPNQQQQQQQQRVVQQTPSQPHANQQAQRPAQPAQHQARRDLPLDPALARLFGKRPHDERPVPLAAGQARAQQVAPVKQNAAAPAEPLKPAAAKKPQAR